MDALPSELQSLSKFTFQKKLKQRLVELLAKAVPYNDLAQKHINDYWSYISLLDIIPKDLKKLLKSTSTPEQITIAEQAKNRNISIGHSAFLIEKAVHRDIYNLFRNEIADAPTVEKKTEKILLG